MKTTLKWTLPALLLAVYALPFLGVVFWSFSRPEPGLGNFAQIAQDGHVHGILLTTFRICAITTVLAVVMAYVVATCWAFASRTGRILIEVFVLIPFWVSPLIRAFAWILVLRGDGVLNNWLIGTGLVDAPLSLVRNEFGVVVGMVHFMVPYALFPIMSSFSQLDTRLLLASRGLGAGRLRTFWQVLFPLTLPGTIGAAVMVFVLSLGFFVTPAILGGGRVVMIAEYIYQQLFQLSDWGLAAALAVVVVAVVGVLVWLLNRMGGTALPQDR
ncbi:ABC transporter permease [Afifella pfennigii]|uniref:ABC transporter permease n=1 Tax=Afifella pfennigii TaxID=209897 RepID=UPI00047CBCB3|nr:ABC transporter permease [Afifella pfennigii]